jgi:hypothetical protein
MDPGTSRTESLIGAIQGVSKNIRCVAVYRATGP